MFGIGMTELIVIFVIGLLVLGPKRLPELARSLGRGIAEFRRASMDVRKEFMDVAEEVRIRPPSMQETAADMPPQAGAEAPGVEAPAGTPAVEPTRSATPETTTALPTESAAAETSKPMGEPTRHG